MVGLTHAAKRPVAGFSKGMARRVALAQALVNAPELLILDEPTSGLDPVACREVKDLIAALAKLGMTVLMSSHLLGDVEDICDRVLILDKGVLRAEGRVADLLRGPGGAVKLESFVLNVVRDGAVEAFKVPRFISGGGQ
jgi:ABC-2 type transport system ATP-binding protein